MNHEFWTWAAYIGFGSFILFVLIPAFLREEDAYAHDIEAIDYLDGYPGIKNKQSGKLKIGET